tara:strand:+ start:207 stop:416 length:210 start_codon:yes stop_codon:yes gene_type:complete
MRFLILILILYFSLFGKSFAYIDPGTGSIILQAIIGFFAAGIATLYVYWNKFKLFICKLFKREKKSEKN